MDTHSFRRCLNSMWPLVYAATWRNLSADELTELRRLCRLLESTSWSLDPLRPRMDALSLALYSSGIFESDRQPARLDSLLHEIDSLRADSLCAEFQDACSHPAEEGQRTGPEELERDRHAAQP